MEGYEAVSIFGDYLLASERSQKTVIGYQSDLRNFERYYTKQYNGPWYVEDTVREDIEQFMLMLKTDKHLGPATRNRILCGLKSFFQHMAYKGVCRVDPTEGIALLRYSRKERHFLVKEDIEGFIAEIDHPIVKVAAWTLAYTGLRISECCRLRMQDVDLHTKVIDVVNGKGRKDRAIPIADKLHTILTTYRDERRHNARQTDRFFATPATGALSPSRLDSVLGETSERLRLKKKVTAHVFRHSFASNLIRQGANVVEVQKLLGHSSLQVTSVYTHVKLEDLASAVNIL